MAILWPNGLTTPPTFSWQGHFGWRNADLSYASRYHRGLDMVEFETVHAIADGEVVRVGRYAGWEGGGYMVWIQHADVFSKSLHLAEGSALVRIGDRVVAGDPIGTMGATNGGAAGMAVHLHLEITEGRWHAYNSGQIDPKAWLNEHVAEDITTGAGGTADAPVIESEEDDVKLYRVTPRGRHYAVAPGFIKHIPGKESVMAYEKVTGVEEEEVDGDEFAVILGVNGIAAASGLGIVGASGGILDERSGQGQYVHGGSWHRVDQAIRWGYLAQKR